MGEAGRRVEPTVTAIPFTQRLIRTYCAPRTTGPRTTSTAAWSRGGRSPKNEASARGTINQKRSHRGLGGGGSGEDREEEAGVTKERGADTQKWQTQNPSGSEMSWFPAPVRETP